MSTLPRRSDRTVTPKEALDSLARAEVGFLALANDNEPYAVPLHFVVQGNTLYFHCAKAGRKLDMISRNPRCCVAVSFLDGIKEGEAACDYGTYYRSALATGVARVVDDTGEKIAALNALTEKHATQEFVPAGALDAAKVVVVAIDIVELTGKARRR
ncbi:MAG: hypothetical protein DDT37_01052 [Firmicutes bacterium]|nr:hypothetical protein [candidate division NPL-UPA2 bacterium]MBT9153804.1 hypothetical protein [candidate division NPL-UPA2 bacterium]MBT9156076.1 hypothetical protein [candidate division NPL-UPA2 bacterium]